MQFKVSKEELHRASAENNLYQQSIWSASFPDFITLEGTPVEESCRCGKMCEITMAVTPKTCACECHFRNRLINITKEEADKLVAEGKATLIAPQLPEELHSAVAGEYAVVLKAMEATINQLTAYLKHHDRN